MGQLAEGVGRKLVTAAHELADAAAEGRAPVTDLLGLGERLLGQDDVGARTGGAPGGVREAALWGEVVALAPLPGDAKAEDARLGDGRKVHGVNEGGEAVAAPDEVASCRRESTMSQRAFSSGESVPVASTSTPAGSASQPIRRATSPDATPPAAAPGPEVAMPREVPARHVPLLAVCHEAFLIGAAPRRPHGAHRSSPKPACTGRGHGPHTWTNHMPGCGRRTAPPLALTSSGWRHRSWSRCSRASRPCSTTLPSAPSSPACAGLSWQRGTRRGSASRWR